MALQRRRRMPGWVMALAVLLVVLVGVPSGCYGYVYERRKAMDYRQEMVGIVHSQEVKKVIEVNLREIDPHALDGRG